MRYIRGERPPGNLGGREGGSHVVERNRKLADLVIALDRDPHGKVPLGKALGCSDHLAQRAHQIGSGEIDPCKCQNQNRQGADNKHPENLGEEYAQCARRSGDKNYGRTFSILGIDRRADCIMPILVDSVHLAKLFILALVKRSIQDLLRDLLFLPFGGGAACKQQDLAVGISQIDVRVNRIGKHCVGRQDNPRIDRLILIVFQAGIGEGRRQLCIMPQQLVTVLLKILRGKGQQHRPQNNQAQQDNG